MQRGDYERVSHAVRLTRDETIKALDAEAAADRTLIQATYRDLAIQLADNFADVNPRFHVEKFLHDALGPTEGALAMDTLRASTTE